MWYNIFMKKKNEVADEEQKAIYDKKIKAVLNLPLEKLQRLGVDLTGKSIIIKDGEITIK